MIDDLSWRERYKNIWCVAPFSSMFIKEWNGKSTILPCCVMDTETNFIQLDQTKTFKNNFDNFSYLREEFVEAELRSEKYTKCGSCVMNLENSQRFSHNAEANFNKHIDYIKNPTLTYLHINFSNRCNLACRMCGVNSSSMLGRESIPHLFDKPTAFFEKIYLDTQSMFYKSILENLENIRYLHFSGGEPFLQPGMWDILEHLEKINRFDVTLQYNTNGTVKLNKRQKELLLKFKEIQFHISMDGIKELAEYIRTGLNWNSWLRNFKDLKSIFNPEIIVTVSVYNLNNLDQIFNFFKFEEQVKCTLNYVYTPLYLCINQISPTAKDYIRKKYEDKKDFQNVIKFMDSKHNDNFLSIPVKINQRDEDVINRKLYKNFKPFSQIDSKWMNLLEEN